MPKSGLRGPWPQAPCLPPRAQHLGWSRGRGHGSVSGGMWRSAQASQGNPAPDLAPGGPEPCAMVLRERRCGARPQDVSGDRSIAARLPAPLPAAARPLSARRPRSSRPTPPRSLRLPQPPRPPLPAGSAGSLWAPCTALASCSRMGIPKVGSARGSIRAVASCPTHGDMMPVLGLQPCEEPLGFRQSPLPACSLFLHLCTSCPTDSPVLTSPQHRWPPLHAT